MGYRARAIDLEAEGVSCHLAHRAAALVDDKLHHDLAFDVVVGKQERVGERSVGGRLERLVNLAGEIGRAAITRPRCDRVRATGRA